MAAGALHRPLTIDERVADLTSARPLTIRARGGSPKIRDGGGIGYFGDGATISEEPRDDAAEQNHARPRCDGGKPCIRGLRITVGTIVGLVASGRTVPEMLAAYPDLEEADIREAQHLADFAARQDAKLTQPAPRHESRTPRRFNRHLE